MRNQRRRCHVVVRAYARHEVGDQSPCRTSLEVVGAENRNRHRVASLPGLLSPAQGGFSRRRIRAGVDSPDWRDLEAGQRASRRYGAPHRSQTLPTGRPSRLAWRQGPRWPRVGGRRAASRARLADPDGSIRNVGSYLLRRIPADGLPASPALDIPTRAHTKRVSHTRSRTSVSSQFSLPRRAARPLARPGPRVSAGRGPGQWRRPARPTPANADMVLITPGANAR